MAMATYLYHFTFIQLLKGSCAQIPPPPPPFVPKSHPPQIPHFLGTLSQPNILQIFGSFFLKKYFADFWHIFRRKVKFFGKKMGVPLIFFTKNWG